MERTTHLLNRRTAWQLRQDLMRYRDAAQVSLEHGASCEDVAILENEIARITEGHLQLGLNSAGDDDPGSQLSIGMNSLSRVINDLRKLIINNPDPQSRSGAVVGVLERARKTFFDKAWVSAQRFNEHPVKGGSWAMMYHRGGELVPDPAEAIHKETSEYHGLINELTRLVKRYNQYMNEFMDELVSAGSAEQLVDTVTTRVRNLPSVPAQAFSGGRNFIFMGSRQDHFLVEHDALLDRPQFIFWTGPDDPDEPVEMPFLEHDSFDYMCRDMVAIANCARLAREAIREHGYVRNLDEIKIPVAAIDAIDERVWPVLLDMVQDQSVWAVSDQGLFAMAEICEDLVIATYHYFTTLLMAPVDQLPDADAVPLANKLSEQNEQV